MLQIKNLTITHKKDLRTIIKDFSFSLNEGDKAVIISEEGNGKSTLLKLLYSEDLIQDYAEYTGTIIKNNKRIGYLAQEMPRECIGLNLYEYCCNIEEFYETTPKELADIALMLGIKTEFFYSQQLISQLSGGEKVKLQFAKLLIEKPDILLLDEPSNDIDIQTLEWLQTFINNSKLPILYISHDETLIENTANTIIHLEQIKRKTEPRHTIVYKSYKEYMQDRSAGLIRQEQLAKKERSEYEKQQEKFRKLKQKVEHDQNAISRQNPSGGRLLKKKMHSVMSMGKRFDKQHEDMTEMPETEEAIFVKFGENASIPNGKRVLDFHLDKLIIEDRVLSNNIDLTIIGPKKICIIGRNGIGKTTLIKEIYQSIINRTDIKPAYMPQNYEELLKINATPVEYLCETGHKDEITRIRTYLGSMKYTADEMSHSISELSGGQKAKTLFLKMSIKGYNVLILDEPTRNFSPLSNPVIREVLKEYKGCIISISHDRKYIEEVCDEVYILNENGLKKKEDIIN